MKLQHDSHVRARLALARRVVSRRGEWGLGDFLLNRKVRQQLTYEELEPLLLAAACDAISAHKWYAGWGDKLSRYEPFGAPQRVIGTLIDVPASVVHSIMCDMTEPLRARVAAAVAAKRASGVAS